ncbi:MAG: glycerol kinase GlpK [Clostridia bacterium]|nr:glycerol kinase GlpK [Clostridia bacterium]
MDKIIAIDEGTTSVRAMLYDLQEKKFTHGVSEEIRQIYPNPGWVEQDAAEIYAKTLSLLVQTLEGTDAETVKGIGITNQRETVVIWNRKTGKPVYNAIVWQCRRTGDFCASIPKDKAEEIREKTGLQIDAYFSASKIKWILDNVAGAREQAERGELCAGTIDCYLLYKLTCGKAFVTDYTNASRTMLFNIHTLRWDGELLKFFGIPESLLPEVKSCTDYMGDFEYKGVKIPIAGVAGDQQAALFGQGCLSEGTGKITYGTGLFFLFNTGKECKRSNAGMVSTIAYSVGKKIVYALEGSVFNAGSSVQWLRDELGFFQNAADSEALALSVEDAGGVYVVPAFTGLGAPYWRGDARAMICGLSRGSDKRHITRAVLESMAYSARELSEPMERDSGVKLKEIRCDGGASANNFLMQFQADVLHVPVNRPVERESTALGAVYLCAIALGLLKEEDVEKMRQTDRVFTPSPDEEKFENLLKGYRKAVERCLL